MLCFDESIEKLETILKCQCDGSMFTFIKIDDVFELECAGCKKRVWISEI